MKNIDNFYMNINWFPGHMQKAKRLMQEQLKLVDIVIELRDSRLPLASANPLIKELINNKKHLIILNKADLSDEEENKKWLSSFENAILLDSTKDNVNKIVSDKIKELCNNILDRANRRGIKNKTIRAMIVGIPNVGKSTMINSFMKKKIVKVEDRPGVTRNLQWIRINNDIELLDTPGVLWPKIENQEDAIKLALIGTINDNILDKELLVNYCLLYLKDNYKGYINKRYNINEENDDLIKEIAILKKIYRANKEIDYYKINEMILKDFRSGKLGRITLEKYVR